MTPADFAFLQLINKHGMSQLHKSELYNKHFVDTLSGYWVQHIWFKLLQYKISFYLWSKKSVSHSVLKYHRCKMSIITVIDVNWIIKKWANRCHCTIRCHFVLLIRFLSMPNCKNLPPFKNKSNSFSCKYLLHKHLQQKAVQNDL